MAIRLESLLVQAQGRPILTIDGLSIDAGEQVAVVGHNGAGKTTLLRLLSGALVPSKGTAEVLGVPTHAIRSDRDRRQFRQRVGLVFQGLHLVPRLTARENVLIGGAARAPGLASWARLFPEAMVREADQALEKIGLAHMADVRVDRLSGGERQKISIARLWLQRPQLILADEPTSALDPSAAAQACGWLRELSSSTGATLVSVVHQPALLPLLASRVVGLRHGQMAWDKPVASLDNSLMDDLYA